MAAVVDDVNLFADAGAPLGSGAGAANRHQVAIVVRQISSYVGLLSRLLFGLGPGPGEDKSALALAQRTGSKHAVKCDTGKDISGGPACVWACPTGAAIRVEPTQFLEVMRRARS